MIRLETLRDDRGRPIYAIFLDRDGKGTCLLASFAWEYVARRFARIYAAHHGFQMQSAEVIAFNKGEVPT